MATPSLQPSQPTYPLTCLRCGGALAPVALGPDSAPWLCNECHRGYFACELTAEARGLYRYHGDDFGRAGTPALRAQVVLEIADAKARGTSVRPDQLGLVNVAALQAVRPASAFATVVSQVLAQRGA